MLSPHPAANRFLLSIGLLTLLALACNFGASRPTEVLPTLQPTATHTVQPVFSATLPPPSATPPLAPTSTLLPPTATPTQELPPLAADSQPNRDGLVLGSIAETEGYLANGGALPFRDLADETYTVEELNTVGNLLEYTIRVDNAARPLLWGSGWCARTQRVLTQNLGHMEFELLVNGQRVDLSTVLQSEYERGSDSYCYGFALVMYGWQADTTEIRSIIRFLEPVNDGADDYPAGELTSVYTVHAPAYSSGDQSGEYGRASAGGLTFDYPIALIQSVKVSAIPADLDSPVPHPDYTQFELLGYPVYADSPRGVARLLVYPLNEFAEVSPAVAEMVNQLLALDPDNLPASMPFPPIFMAAQLFTERAHLLTFDGGVGYAYLTQFGQDYGPITNAGLTYVFTGVTDSGLLIVAILPVNSPGLPATYEQVADDWYDTYYNNYSAYLDPLKANLRAFTPAEFTPSLITLDGILLSFDAQP